MLMIKSINLVILFSLLSVGIHASPVLAKPISNTLKSTVNVTSTSSNDEGYIGNEDDISNSDNGSSTGSGGANNIININNAINATSEGGTLRIRSGEYTLDYIENKNITIECADENGYVDIRTIQALPVGIKIKVGERVTINQEGINPINLSWGVYQRGSGIPPTVLTWDEIILNVGTNKEVELKIRQEVKNKLGFHDLKVILKVNNAENVLVSKVVSGTLQSVALEGEGTYNLGRLPDYPIDTIIKLKFINGGEYIIDLWADDGR